MNTTFSPRPIRVPHCVPQVRASRFVLLRRLLGNSFTSMWHPNGPSLIATIQLLFVAAGTLTIGAGLAKRSDLWQNWLLAVVGGLFVTFLGIPRTLGLGPPISQGSHGSGVRWGTVSAASTIGQPDVGGTAGRSSTSAEFSTRSSCRTPLRGWPNRRSRGSIVPI